MAWLVRVVLLGVIFFLLLSVVVAIAADETGAVEKLVLGAVGLALIAAATRVRRTA